MLFADSAFSTIPFCAPFSAGGIVAVSIDEVASAFDTITPVVTASPSITETTKAVAVITNNAVVANTVTETIQISDTATQWFLWELIDDDQTPSWSSINTF